MACVSHRGCCPDTLDQSYGKPPALVLKELEDNITRKLVELERRLFKHVEDNIAVLISRTKTYELQIFENAEAQRNIETKVGNYLSSKMAALQSEFDVKLNSKVAAAFGRADSAQNESSDKAGYAHEGSRMDLKPVSIDNVSLAVPSSNATRTDVQGIANITADSAHVHFGLNRAVEERLDSLEKRVGEIQALKGRRDVQFAYSSQSTPPCRPVRRPMSADGDVDDDYSPGEAHASETSMDLKTQANITAKDTRVEDDLLTHPVVAPVVAVVTENKTQIADNKVKIADLHERHQNLHHSHQALCESLKEIQDGHNYLRAQMASLPQALELGLEDLDENTTRHVKGSDFNFELDVSYDRRFEPSIWDGMFFLYLPSMGIVHTMFIALGFLATLFAQAIFMAAILKGGTASSAFLNDQYPSAESISSWRLHAGHSLSYYDSLSGNTLVSRVCDGDASLSEAGVYQTLQSDLSTYLANRIGVYLCSATLFVWALTITQNFSPVVSAIFSLIYIRHDDCTKIGKASYVPYKFKIEQITRRRFCGLTCVMLLRGSVVVITGVTGALWLANTKNLENLILNASALSLILSVDVLAYGAFLPKKLKSFMESAQPLELPARSIGGVIYQIIRILLTFLFTFIFIFWDVLPNERLLEEKIHMLCAGNLDFVYTRHAPTDTLYAASTKRRGAAILRDYEHSIKHLMSASQHDNLSSISVGITPNAGKVTLVHSQDMRAYVQAHMTYHPFCTDSTGENHRTYTLRKRAGTNSSSSCADWTSWCGKQTGDLFRLLCPITCGCANPRAGMLYRVESEGCPVALCEQTDHYKNILSGLVCRDWTPDELKLSLEWDTYFKHLVNFEWVDRERVRVEKVVNIVREAGCAGIPLVRVGEIHFDFCGAAETSAARPGMSSLRAFCPITCKCMQMTPWKAYDCPRTCFNSSTTNFTDLYNAQ